MSIKNSYLDISERKILLRFFDVFIIVITLFLASKYFNFQYIKVENDLVFQWYFVLAIYFLLFGEIFQLYSLRVSNDYFLVVKSAVLASSITTLFYIFSPYITPSLPQNRLEIGYFFLMITLPVIVWRFLYISLLFSPKYFKTIIIIGHSSKVMQLLKLIKYKNIHRVAAYISNEEIEGYPNFLKIDSVNISELAILNKASEIIVSTDGFSDSTIENLNKLLVPIFESGTNIKSFENYYEDVTDSVPQAYLDNDFYKNINYSKHNENKVYLFTTRGIGFIISIFGLVLMSILLPPIFIGNLIANRGNLFYRQERVGKKGKPFKIIKFRSMVTNAEANGAVWATKNDVRITPFGKFLRNTRIDEMPQFYNILKGDMNLIGPRPERPEFVKSLSEQIPFYGIRHVVSPGLTGWAQVNYPYASTIEDQETKLRYDLFYIKERSFFLDFKILIKTMTTILFFRGQ